MKHEYAVSLSETAGQTPQAPAMSMTFQSHDDLKEIVAKVIDKKLFDENESKVFAVGLKMFATIMLAHRNEPLFAELAPHFGTFMKTLKS